MIPYKANRPKILFLEQGIIVYPSSMRFPVFQSISFGLCSTTCYPSPVLSSFVFRLFPKGAANHMLSSASTSAQKKVQSEANNRLQKRMRLTDSQLDDVPLAIDRLLKETGFHAPAFPNKSNHQTADTKYDCLARVAKLSAPMQRFTSAIRVQEGFLSNAVVFGIGPDGDNWANKLSHDLKKARDSFECSQERRSRFSCWTTFQSTAIAVAKIFLKPTGADLHPVQEANLIKNDYTRSSWCCWVNFLFLSLRSRQKAKF